MQPAPSHPTAPIGFMARAGSTRARLIVLFLLVGSTTALGQIASNADPRRAPRDDLSPTLRNMQADETQNPGMLWVQQGRLAFEAQCQQCHGADRLRSAAARHPAVSALLGRPVTLAERINLCRTQRLQRPAYAPEADEALALAAYLGHLSRGHPIDPPRDPITLRWAERGRQLYVTRFGQLALSCAQCHDQASTQRLAGALVTQGHPTGYPIYRLEWQGMGSLQRRMRGCLNGVRAEPYAHGSDELLALEVYLMQRAAGLRVDTPGVRP
jgi:L-cysteine S-thiosulfotransferase